MEDELLGQNKPLRKAISYAIDRKKFIEMFSNNRADEAYGFIPPIMKAYNPEIEKFGMPSLMATIIMPRETARWQMVNEIRFVCTATYWDLFLAMAGY